MNTPPVLRVLQASDFHLCADPDTLTYGTNTDQSLCSVLNVLREYALPDGLLIATGDLSQDGSAASYDRLGLILQRTGLEFCCLPGNHDDAPRMRASLPCPQRIRRAGWHVILLDTTLPDSPGGSIKESDLLHIGEWLHEFPNTPCLIFMHHAAVSVASPWLDTMRIDNADNLLNCLASFDQIKAVVFGHVHQELDIHYRGIRFLACPSTCAQFLPKSAQFALDPIAPGFRWIDLYGNGHMETGIVRV
ncbi:phosphodiesterase [Candidatus Methylospira mobilis]|uniref:Phosphodiesterase n=1 Tax=Candidatus Methylospira mobilis TaxID=1808979 RepID=A0A5Q0BH47_9GAMM|nr:metallophosphoesterase [Candidatus Methylospira mobilis]QFY42859.1 phosphodiesterase [Candidatus Methylospira mobilis]WNV04075.1 metallophosphoesterase [Candidatus Methylospira mobilis]